MSYSVAPDGIVPVHSLPELSDAITQAAIVAQDRPSGLYVAQADFDEGIAGRVIDFAETATSYHWGNNFKEDGRMYLPVEGTDLESFRAIDTASNADPELAEAFNMGINDAIPHIHRLGASILHSLCSTNYHTGPNYTGKWHKDWSRQVAVVVAPNPFEALFAKSMIRGKMGYSQSVTLPAGIVGIRGTGAMLDFVQRGVAHAFNNPKQTTRHSVVANAWIRPSLIRAFRLR